MFFVSAITEGQNELCHPDSSSRYSILLKMYSGFIIEGCFMRTSINLYVVLLEKLSTGAL